MPVSQSHWRLDQRSPQKDKGSHRPTVRTLPWIRQDSHVSNDSSLARETDAASVNGSLRSQKAHVPSLDRLATDLNASTITQNDRFKPQPTNKEGSLPSTIPFATSKIDGREVASMSTSTNHRIPTAKRPRDEAIKAQSSDASVPHAREKAVSLDEPPIKRRRASLTFDDAGTSSSTFNTTQRPVSAHDKDDSASSTSGLTASDTSQPKRQRCHVCDLPFTTGHSAGIQCTTCVRRYHNSCLQDRGSLETGLDKLWQCRRCIEKCVSLERKSPAMSSLHSSEVTGENPVIAPISHQVSSTNSNETSGSPRLPSHAATTQSQKMKKPSTDSNRSMRGQQPHRGEPAANSSAGDVHRRPDRPRMMKRPSKVELVPCNVCNDRLVPLNPSGVQTLCAKCRTLSESSINATTGSKTHKKTSSSDIESANRDKVRTMDASEETTKTAHVAKLAESTYTASEQAIITTLLSKIVNSKELWESIIPQKIEPPRSSTAPPKTSPRSIEEEHDGRDAIISTTTSEELHHNCEQATSSGNRNVDSIDKSRLPTRQLQDDHAPIVESPAVLLPKSEAQGAEAVEADRKITSSSNPPLSLASWELGDKGLPTYKDAQHQKSKSTSKPAWIDADDEIDFRPSLYDEWGEYHPSNRLDRTAKLAEISRRPRRKQLFGKPAIYSPLGTMPILEPRRGAGSRASSSANAPARSSTDKGTRLWHSDGTAVVHYDSVEDFLGVKDDLILTLYEGKLYYRDGRRNQDGTLSRPTLLCPTGI